MIKDRLSEQLKQWQERLKPTEYLLAFSGGRDSAALLHMMVSLRRELNIPLRACYIHHGWSEAADNWGRFCQQQAASYQVPYIQQSIQTEPEDSGGPEAQARTGRYRSLAKILKPGGVLLTAHHLDDQVETFLLQLLRGSGIDGLSGMPALRKFAGGEHWRPLLQESRQIINQYISQYHIDYIDDPSNEQTRYKRNYIRHDVLPVLYQGFPKAGNLIARSAQWLSETQHLQQQLLDQQLGKHISDVLDWQSLKQQGYGEITEKALIRRWLQRLACPPPPFKRLQELWLQLQQENPGHAQLCYRNLRIIHYRGKLFLYHNTQPQTPPPVFSETTDWPGIGILLALSVKGYQRADLHWGNYPCKGKIQLPQQRYPTELKNLFQQYAVPPYLRRRLPILFHHDEILWIGLLGKSKQAQNIQIEWQKKAHSVSIPKN